MTEAAELDTRILGTDRLGETLLKALIAELRTLKDPWDDLTQQQQDERIERLRQNVKHLIRSAATVLFAADYPACVAELQSVNFADGIKATLKIAKTEASRHDIADRVGQNVIVVVADVGPYLEGIEDVKAAAAQRDMFSQDRPKQPPKDDSADVVKGALDKLKGSQPLPFGSVAGELGKGPEPAPPLAPAQQEVAKLLDAIGNPVDQAVLRRWTASELEAALLWGKRKFQYPQTLTPMPPFIPVNPQPVGSADAAPKLTADDFSSDPKAFADKYLDQQDQLPPEDDDHHDGTDDAAPPEPKDDE
jgi:hypothetical protein